MQDLIKETVWCGAYKNIAFEVNEPTENYKWRYYIFIKLDWIQDKELANDLWLETEDITIVPERPRRSYPYMQNSFLSSLEFHGGITWYSKKYDIEGRKVIKIGCDYNHAFDERRIYSKSDVFDDVKATINDFLDEVGYQLPEYLTPKKEAE